MSETIRVMIVDDHDMVRSGLEVLLETHDELEMVGEASSGDEALIVCEAVQPHVILMDLMMPRMNGIDATRTILERHPDTKVIALTSFKDDELIMQALDAGAISYLLKNVSIDELVDAILRAHSGQSTLAPEATQALIKAATQPSVPGDDLTPRERDVLELMVQALNNREIGDRLTISVSTVKNHVSNILAKLQVENRVEAVALAIENKLLD